MWSRGKVGQYLTKNIMPNLDYFETKEERNQWYRDYRKLRGEKLREYTRNFNNKWRRKFGYAAEARSRKKYPEKELARRKLQHAVRNGLILRGSCSVCGKPKAQAHHDDYSKPLEVKWFCPLHHRQYEDKYGLRP